MNKKYNIGYAPGTFDLFHKGHLNVLKKAKELCDYLIVGVYTDECVQSCKNINTVFNTESRVSIIKAIKYVDEVCTKDTKDKLEAWKQHKFDVVIVGDDWEGTPDWIQYEKALNKVGADVIYVPYTKGISTSLIKEMLSVKKFHHV